MVPQPEETPSVNVDSVQVVQLLRIIKYLKHFILPCRGGGWENTTIKPARGGLGVAERYNVKILPHTTAHLSLHLLPDLMIDQYEHSDW